ncbi:hypothetical protein APY03_2483 [Variovorax sp. WDL1]|nr:hypothetical protein APY03_2483 [Variovorax sp. WDL1]
MRVFVDRDYQYGYFVDEHKLFGLLTPEQQLVYLAGGEAKLDIEPATAQVIIDDGTTPYAKPQVAEPIPPELADRPQ